MSAPDSLLRQYWGYPQFRPGQSEIIADLLAQQDALIVMPTGGGKSLCFQVPALLQPGLTIVISPLIALMENQVQALIQREISAAYLHNQQVRDDRRTTTWKISTNQLKLLYISPETLFNAYIWNLLTARSTKISSLIVDEAHCVTQWGQGFRPLYLRLGTARSPLEQAQSHRINIAAFTATATPTDQQRISEILQLRSPAKFINSTYRSNLHLQVKRVISEGQRQYYLKQFLKQQANQSGLIYVRTRDDAEKLSRYLRGCGWPSTAYHAGLATAQRRTIEQQWLNDSLPIVICTVAFGMGIDKPNCRWILHYHAPWRLSEYLQEIGRAGRDGKMAQALLLASEPTGWLDGSDRRRWQFFASQLAPEHQPQDLLQPYLATQDCRWAFLTQAFGDANFHRCGHCDRCSRIKM
jgi:ATP-dependent DNA helicase RecQ